MHRLIFKKIKIGLYFICPPINHPTYLSTIRPTGYRPGLLCSKLHLWYFLAFLLFLPVMPDFHSLLLASLLDCSYISSSTDSDDIYLTYQQYIVMHYNLTHIISSITSVIIIGRLSQTQILYTFSRISFGILYIIWNL